jgi:hypothetical protein
VHILGQSYGRQLPSRDLTTLFASIRRIKRLNEREFANVFDALGEASLSLNLGTFRDPSKHINIGTLYGELDDALRSMNLLITGACMSLLRREGWLINQKKTRRIYRELGLQLRNKTPKRRVA